MKDICNKWVPLDESLSKEYDCTGYICKSCKIFKYPTFVHSGGIVGDYTCYKCGGDGNLRNICIYCNNIVRTGGNRRKKAY
jgi:hypothetical protein